MKIAVTSASGQLGSSIIKKAKEKFGHNNVIGLARTPEKAKHLGVEIRKGDYNIPQNFIDGLKDIDVVTILSGNDHPDKRIQQHRNIINAAKSSGVRKIVYTSIFGKEDKCVFDNIIKSNRQTEKDIIESGLQYAIGRNGLYIEPDIEAIPEYLKEGKITNCAGDGKCGYTTRDELAEAYSCLISNDNLNGDVYNLFGKVIAQLELTSAINKAYGYNLVYNAISVEGYLKDRTNAYGDFFGKIIAGIYEGILNGAFDLPSDFESVTGREHQSIQEYLSQAK